MRDKPEQRQWNSISCSCWEVRLIR